MNLEVKIKRIHDDALLPMQANPRRCRNGSLFN